MSESIHTSYDAIGSAATPSTLTASFAGNSRVFSCRYQPNIHLDINYVPNVLSTDAFLLVEVDISNDDGTTFFPISSQIGTTTNIAVYADGSPYMTTGIPIIMPGDQTSIGGTTYSGTVDLTTVASHIRIRCRESVSSNFGNVYVRASFLS